MARFRRKRRGTGGTWFPMVGAVGATFNDDPQGAVWGTPLNINCGNATQPLTTFIRQLAPQGGAAQVAANHQSNAGITSPLGDLLQDEYFIKRIVGKIHIAQSEDDGTGDQVRVAAGIFVSQVNRGLSLGVTPGELEELWPIGVKSAWTGTWTSDGGEDEAEAALLYNPLANSTIRQPWIWRRSWILGRQGNTGDWPQNNGRYGSVLDGPHIDQKTKRRVHKDEGLFLALGVQLLSGGESDTLLEGWFECRMFAGLRKAHDKGVF